MNQTIPQPVAERLEDEWRQMREVNAQTKTQSAPKK